MAVAMKAQLPAAATRCDPVALSSGLVLLQCGNDVCSPPACRSPERRLQRLEGRDSLGLEIPASG